MKIFKQVVSDYILPIDFIQRTLQTTLQANAANTIL